MAEVSPLLRNTAHLDTAIGARFPEHHDGPNVPPQGQNLAGT